MATDKPEYGTTQDVDALVTTIFFADATWSDPNLARVRAHLVEGQDNPDAVLELYRHIRAGGQVLNDERSPVHASLKLAGIVKVFPGGVLRPRNRIYEQVFDLTWVEAIQSPRWRLDVDTGGTLITGSGNVVVGSVYTGAPTSDPAAALTIYRRVLVDSARHLSLRSLDVGASDPTSQQQRFDLTQVYVDLHTTTQVPSADGKRPRRTTRQRPAEPERAESRPLPVLEAIIGHHQVVLLGDPGSGKSTVLTHLALCLAAHGLLRGGAFYVDHQFVRCAFRLRDVARSFYGHFGFRVVVAGHP